MVIIFLIKETQSGFKEHLFVDIDGNPPNILITKENVDER